MAGENIKIMTTYKLVKLWSKFWQWAITPHRIEKVKETADFHKKCEYHQNDIQKLFDGGVFDLKNGSAEIFKDWEGHVRRIKLTQWTR